MQAVISADRLRLALLEGNAQVAERTRRASERAVDAELCDVAAGDLAVEKARFSFQQGPSQEAIAMLKRAILVYQELDDQAGLARANLDFGLILLAQEDLLGAREYFLLASRSAGNSPDVFEQMRARVLMLVCDFVYGNLSRSLAQADELDERAAATAMREIQLFAELARGRIAFELGRYAEASDVFSRGRSRARLYAMHEPGSVMERWLARSLIYDGRVKRGVEILRDRHRGAESCFFLAEGLLRAGEHGEAIAMLEDGLEAGESDPDPLEGVSWSTGFAPFEDRAIGVVTGSKVLKHQMMALRGYLFAESGRPADGVQEMHRLTRELRISEIDPYNRIYFYLYSLILPESGELNVEDRSTVLGKAVRFIQQRTSRMDEYTHKTDYLRLNYWNSKLMSHAQTHNLV
jgi:tetratricopeptide (TPR) repeat protein